MPVGFPWRDEGRVEGLITAEEGYPAFEQLVANARSDVRLAFRVFDPTTRLRGANASGETWLDLLSARLSSGVAVRVMIADFDPIAAPALHEATWRAVAALMPVRNSGDLQVLPVRHNARVGPSLRYGLWPAAVAALERQRRSLNALDSEARHEAYAARPGIWRHLRPKRDGRLAWRRLALPHLYPVTHHQKFAVADGSSVIVGGLDIDERRYDDNHHQRPTEDTWHDVALQITGSVAADFAQHFATTWNDARLHAAAQCREQSSLAPRGATPMPEPVEPLAGSEAKPSSTAGVARLRLLRTRSASRHRAPWALAPDTRRRELEAAHLKLFGEATEFVYLETQFLRSSRISDALAEAAHRAPNLGLVLLLPGAPEDVAFEDAEGITARFGEARQADCIATISEAFGERAAIVSPVRPVAGRGKGRATLHGSEIVYVHAKVSIVDDRRAIVGSANLNGRSMRWDTEAAVEWAGSEGIAGLRHRLGAKWLADDTAQSNLALSDVPALWRSTAEANCARRPEDRRGFIVPYDPSAAADFGIHVPGATEDIV